jgi:hypothetical protein
VRSASIPLFALLVLLSATPAFAQKTATLRGIVLIDSTEIPLVGAEVTIGATRLIASSDAAGRFVLPSIPSGKQLVTVKRMGFAPITAVLDFAPGDTLVGDFLMVTATAKLKGVTVRERATATIKLVGFEERRKAGYGNFIGPERLQGIDARQTADVLQQIPGPHIFRSTNSGSAWVAGGRGVYNTGAYNVDRSDRSRGAPRDQCYATVYLDGSPVFSALPGELLFDINSIPASMLGAIEYYNGSSSIPEAYPQKRGTCGVLMIWTKV